MTFIIFIVIFIFKFSMKNSFLYEKNFIRNDRK